jgi:hypothetical protein
VIARTWRAIGDDRVEVMCVA